MTLFFDILLVAILGFIAFQDFQSRSVGVLLIIGCAAVSCWFAFSLGSLYEALLYIAVNVLVVLMQLLGVALYFWLKNGKATNLLKGYIGLGDVLFLFAITPLLSPLVFTVFLAFGYFVVLLLFLLFRAMSVVRERTIPLAGGLALLLLLAWVARMAGLCSFDDLEMYVQQVLV